MIKLQNILFGLIAIGLVACKQSRVDDANFAVDPNFVPSTSYVNVLEGGMDTLSCFYENNFVKVYVEQKNLQYLSWIYIKDGSEILMGQELEQILTVAGQYRLKHHFMDQGSARDTIINFDLSYCPAHLDFSDAFTPNGDGQFDTWAPIAVGVKTVSFSVRDSKNFTLFESTSTDNGWDGNAQGRKMPSGTYYYKATGVFKNGFQFQYNGELQLIR